MMAGDTDALRSARSGAVQQVRLVSLNGSTLGGTFAELIVLADVDDTTARSDVAANEGSTPLTESATRSDAMTLPSGVIRK